MFQSCHSHSNKLSIKLLNPEPTFFIYSCSSISTPLYLVVHWFFSCFGFFCCSSVFFLVGFSWRLAALLRLSGQSGTQNKSRDIKYAAKTNTYLSHAHCKAHILPWTMQLPCHKLLSMLCHPICLNHHSEKEKSKFTASADENDYFLTSISSLLQKSHPRLTSVMFIFTSPALWKRCYRKSKRQQNLLSKLLFYNVWITKRRQVHCWHLVLFFQFLSSLFPQLSRTSHWFVAQLASELTISNASIPADKCSRMLSPSAQWCILTHLSSSACKQHILTSIRHEKMCRFHC